MFSAQAISTPADQALARSLAGNDLNCYGSILKSMIRACTRSVPFSTVNVVARVTFLSTVGMYCFCKGNRRVSYDIFTALHDFTNARSNWLDLVRTCREIQKDLELSKEFSEELIGYFRENGFFLMQCIDVIPGDVTVGPASAAHVGGTEFSDPLTAATRKTALPME